MTIFEFLQELESFFPLNETDDIIKKRIAFYTEILEAEVAKTGKSYNYRQITEWFLKTYKYKSFPALPNILEALPHGEVQSYKECSDEGSVLIVTLASGYQYQFTVSGIGKPIDDIKSTIKQKFGDCTYKFYPKGTVITENKTLCQRYDGEEDICRQRES